MNTNTMKPASIENQTSAVPGGMMLFINLALLIGAIVWLVMAVVYAASEHDPAALWWLIPAILLEILAIILLCGHFTLQPNEARVLILFGAYNGTVRTSGFWWANPFYSRARGRIPFPPGSASPEAVRAAAAKGISSNSLLNPVLAPKFRCGRAISTARNSR